MISSSGRRILVWITAAAAATFFLATSFRNGWTRVETDFPNYYTAAVLARHHMPLERYYDWPWFQRQMNYTGTERQLGGYIPHTPLTLVPFLPLSGLKPQTAKQLWLLLNLIFLGISVTLLARLAQVSTGMILLIAFAGYLPLDANFLLGQYYVFLLFLMTLGVWTLVQRRDFTGGFLMGVICMLKLYTAPFVVYFIWKRQWRSLLGMLAACLGMGAISVAWFGSQANVYYVTHVLVRASEGMILDPYHPGTGTFTTLLRRSFMAEPELNPHPLFNVPFVAFLLQPLLTLLVLVAALLAMPRDAAAGKREVAWFLIAILLASPYTASYVFILLLVPVAILLAETTGWYRITLVTMYALLCLPLRPAWSWLFPKVWLLLVLYLIVGRGFWSNLRLRPVIAASLIIATISLFIAWRHQRSYDQEPARKFESVASTPSSIYASNPSISRTGIVFESIGPGRYTLNRNLSFEGHAFHPSVPASGNPIFFELVAKEHSRIMSFDPATKALESQTPDAWNATAPVITPSGTRLAFISDGKLFIQREDAVVTPRPVQDAAWFPDESHLAFSMQGVIYDSKDMRPLTTSIAGEHSEPAVSPDGKWLAFTATHFGIEHVWVEDLSSRAASELTGGNCNSYAPAWDPDSIRLVFASDCGRGLGLPRLYRARVR